MSTATAESLRVERIDPIADPAWAAFLAGCDAAEIYHSPQWLELIRAQYGYEFTAHVVRGGDGTIEAGLPVARVESFITGKRLVAVPFSDTCPPLVGRDADPDAGAALGAALAAAAERDGLPLSVHGPLEGVPEDCLAPQYVRHELALDTDIEKLEAAYSKKRAVREFRKGKKAGLTFEVGRDRRALDEFYALHLLTRRKLGVPIQPKRFIRRFEHLFEEGHGFVGLIRDGDTALAAAVFLIYNGTITYKYGASDPAALEKRPNHLMQAEAIAWGCLHGLKRYDFGRTDVGAEGLRSFKDAWGATEVPLPYTYLGQAPPIEEGPGAKEQLTEKVIQRSPAFVARVAGELLYRHYGQ
ncbi:MAG TPA: GNAT family N-acetyltransferase [Solirubrobacterales bacterium]|jgi:CelD/BcsL family acetyltransferase involved in cellulose biosynthesis|nr:GNAT family N-acetyltransferase [Solirubrobacterales bacterium]